MEDLDEANPSFHQATSRQTKLAEWFGCCLIHAVQVLRFRRFCLQAENLRDRGLHSERQFIGFDASPQRFVIRVFDPG